MQTYFKSILHYFLTLLALPLVAPYGAVVWARNFLFDKGILKTYRSSMPVICVGSYLVGGTGKTPTISLIAQILTELGHKPVILSRGYGGKLLGPHLVKNSDLPEQVGDEPLMLTALSKSQAPVVISKSRVAGAKFIERERLGNIILLDDGYQHRYLERDLNILLIPQKRSLRDAILLPAGRMRETLNSAVSRANIVLVVSRDEVGKFANHNYNKFSLPTFDLSIIPGEIFDTTTNEKLAIDCLDKLPVTAVAAIAQPEQFFKMLEKLGARIERKISFRDHHNYSSDDWINIAKDSKLMITTAKDYIKLRKFSEPTTQLAVLDLKIELPANQKDLFTTELRKIFTDCNQ
jgi:tetraacyldisaccharide 4'-kinase